MAGKMGDITRPQKEESKGEILEQVWQRMGDCEMLVLLICGKQMCQLSGLP